jgi:hypothetical protein
MAFSYLLKSHTEKVVRVSQNSLYMIQPRTPKFSKRCTRILIWHVFQQHTRATRTLYGPARAGIRVPRHVRLRVAKQRQLIFFLKKKPAPFIIPRRLDYAPALPPPSRDSRLSRLVSLGSTDPPPRRRGASLRSTNRQPQRAF